MSDSIARQALARNVAARIVALGDAGDEIRILDGILLRLEIGRQRYGALDLSRPRDWQVEADQEAIDLAVYQACKRESLRLEQTTAVERGLDELRSSAGCTLRPDQVDTVCALAQVGFFTPERARAILRGEAEPERFDVSDVEMGGEG